tara:strand:- start:69 stop:743 length:675 start_codon:yes stop_codon:yes gene_type:complete
MRKITIVCLFLLGMISTASAELGVRIGIGAEIGEYDLSGSETTATETQKSEANDGNVYVPLGSVFIEKQLSFMPSFLERLSVGYSFVPHDVKSATVGGDHNNRTASQDVTVSNKAKVEIEDIHSLYATLDITNWLYIKAGSMDMDVKTKERLGTGSEYPDFSTEGSFLGLGLHKTMDNGVFVRFEFEETEIDGAKVTSTVDANNSVTLDDFDGTIYRISIGKSF